MSLFEILSNTKLSKWDITFLYYEVILIIDFIVMVISEQQVVGVLVIGNIVVVEIMSNCKLIFTLKANVALTTHTSAYNLFSGYKDKSITKIYRKTRGMKDSLKECLFIPQLQKVYPIFNFWNDPKTNLLLCQIEGDISNDSHHKGSFLSIYLKLDLGFYSNNLMSHCPDLSFFGHFVTTGKTVTIREEWLLYNISFSHFLIKC